MKTGAAARQTGYTWSDYRTWDDDQRWQIIGGDAYAMTPAPATRHQRLVARLFRQMDRFFRGKACEVLLSPVDVKLSDEDIVQPDLVVVCDRGKIKPTHIEGAPTLVVEVLSPSTALLDRTRKMALFARSGVKEVWLITPYPWLAEVFVLDGQTYRLSGAFSKEDTLTSPTFEGLRLDLKRVFDFPLEPGEEIQMVKEARPLYGSKPAAARRRGR